MTAKQTPKQYRQGIPFSVRETFELRSQGMSLKQIAEELGTSTYLVKRVLTEWTDPR